MIRFHFNARKIAVVLGLAVAVNSTLPSAQAKNPLGGAGAAISGGAKSFGGGASNTAKSWGGAASNTAKSWGGAASNTSRSVQNQTRQAGKPLGTVAKDTRQTISNSAKNSTSTGTNQGRRLLSEVRQEAKTTQNTVQNGVRSQVNTTKDLARTGVNTAATIQNQTNAAAAAAANRASREASNAIPSAQKYVFGPHPEIIKPTFPERGKVTKPIVKGPKSGQAGPLGQTQRPDGQILEDGVRVAKKKTAGPNAASQIIGAAGVAAATIIGAATSGNGTESIESFEPGFIVENGGSTITSSETLFEATDGMPVADVQPIQLYNLGDSARNFTIETGADQREDATLEAGDGVELTVDKAVVTFLSNGQARRYTLSAGQAYKFAKGTTGQIDLFSFNPEELAAK